MAQKFCTRCGAELKPGLKFCVNCGAEVKQDNKPVSSNSDNQSKQPEKGLLSYIPSLIVSIALCIVIFALISIYYSQYTLLIIFCSVIAGVFVANIVVLLIFVKKNKQKTPVFMTAFSLSCLAMVGNLVMFSIGTAKYVERQSHYHTVTVINGNHGILNVSYRDYQDGNDQSINVTKNNTKEFRLSYRSYIEFYCELDFGYGVSITLTDDDNNKIPMMSYRFEMPDCDVTIKATYSLIDTSDYGYGDYY